MTKLYFRYGCVGSAKTMNLLSIAHTYEMQHKKILVLKPSIDIRFGKDVVASRCGLKRDALEVDTPEDMKNIQLTNISCILYDECQFASVELIDYFRKLTVEHSIPIICFGLKTDYKTNLFPASKRLLEISDDICEVKSTCQVCGKKSIVNKRIVPECGNIIDLGTEDKYIQVCWKHY